MMLHDQARPWRLIFAFILLAVLALAIACGGPAPTPTPTPTPTPIPTPTPTPTPTPVPKPIVVNPEGDPQGFFQALPSGEVDCLTRAFGAQGILQLLGRDPSPEDMVKLKGCMSEETARRMLLGMMAMAPGGPSLSDKSIACVLTESMDISFLDLLLQMGGEGQEGPGPGFMPIMRVLLKCLSDEEMAGVQMGGGEGGGPTMAQMKCLFENADDATLAKLFAGGEGSQPPPEAMPLIIKCGLTGPGGGGPGGGGPGEGPRLTPGQLSCLTAAIGEKAALELLAGQRGPTAEEVTKIQACGIPLGPGPGG